MSVMAGACAHTCRDRFTIDDLTTFDREMFHLTGIPYRGLIP